LSDEEEMKLDVIWVADADGGKLSQWRVAEDTPDLRRQVGIPSTA
jgi:hypothetical protein